MSHSRGELVLKPLFFTVFLLSYVLDSLYIFAAFYVTSTHPVSLLTSGTFDFCYTRNHTNPWRAMTHLGINRIQCTPHVTSSRIHYHLLMLIKIQDLSPMATTVTIATEYKWMLAAQNTWPQLFKLLWLVSLLSYTSRMNPMAHCVYSTNSKNTSFMRTEFHLWVHYEIRNTQFVTFISEVLPVTLFCWIKGQKENIRTSSFMYYDWFWTFLKESQVLGNLSL